MSNPSQDAENRLRRRVAARDLPPARLAVDALPLMHPTLVADLPRGRGWLFELKWDGVRVLALRAGGRVRLHARSGNEITDRYPEVAADLVRVGGADLALDGEIVALDAAGTPRFELLQRRMHLTGAREIAAAARAVRASAYFFDCLALFGRDLRGLPLSRRKELLGELLPAGDGVRYCDHVVDEGERFLAAVAAAGVEGMVAKRAQSLYRGGRSADWLKIKCALRQEFVIGGYTAPKGTRAHLGAVHLGVYEDRDLVYVGRAGSGFDTRSLRDLAARLAPLATTRCPFTRGDPPRGPEHHWVRPVLVCEVRFGQWTEDGHVRHPVFLGLRADKPAAAVRRELPTPRS